MATVNGARVLGLDDRIGTLEAGKRTDIILVDLRRPHPSTHGDPASAPVFSATGNDVRTVIVDGRMVRVRQVTTLDEF